MDIFEGLLSSKRIKLSIYLFKYIIFFLVCVISTTGEAKCSLLKCNVFFYHDLLMNPNFIAFMMEQFCEKIGFNSKQIN